MKLIHPAFLAGIIALLLGLAGCVTQPEAEAPPTPLESGEPADPTPAKPEEPKAEANLPEAPKDGDEVAVLETAKGKIIVMFYPEVAPKHVENFKSLVKEGFYDGTRFHRCIPGFMIQGGDPKSKDLSLSAEWGTGGKMNPDGSERNVDFEGGNLLKHTRGVLSAARSSDPNSASSQFFLMHQAYPSLDGEYSAFGKIVSGIEVVDEIVQTGAQSEKVPSDKAVVLKKATLAKWPVK